MKANEKKRQIELCYLFSQSLHTVLLLSKVFSSLSLDPLVSSHLEREASAICLGASKPGVVRLVFPGKGDLYDAFLLLL